MKHVIRALAAWPEPATGHRQSGRKFRGETHNSWPAVINGLLYEADWLGVGLVVIEVVTTATSRARRDGSLPADVRTDHPGVVVSMDSSRGPLRIATDVYEGYQGCPLRPWQLNVRAVTLGMEALRAVDRHGITASGQQYRGFNAIESGAITTPVVMSTDEAAGVLAVAAGWAVGTIQPGVTPQDILRMALRKAARTGSPTFGGDAGAWARVEEAYRVLGGDPE